MKDGIHPKYQDCVVTCGCGNTFQTRSTRAKIAVEVCSKCHPYFTGSVKFVDAAGRVDRFNKKFQGTYGKAQEGGRRTGRRQDLARPNPNCTMTARAIETIDSRAVVRCRRISPAAGLISESVKGSARRQRQVAG